MVSDIPSRHSYTLRRIYIEYLYSRHTRNCRRVSYQQSNSNLGRHHLRPRIRLWSSRMGPSVGSARSSSSLFHLMDGLHHLSNSLRSRTQFCHPHCRSTHSRNIRLLAACQCRRNPCRHLASASARKGHVSICCRAVSRPCPRASHRWLPNTIRFLEMDILAVSHLRRRHAYQPLLSPRNLRQGPPRGQGTSTPQRNQKSQFICQKRKRQTHHG